MTEHAGIPRAGFEHAEFEHAGIDHTDRPVAHHLDWPGCHNARDVGGLPTTGGRRIRLRALVRSDSHCHLTDEGVAMLRAYGVSRVLDLRMPEECAAWPSRLRDDPMYRNLPMLDPSDGQGRSGDGRDRSAGEGGGTAAEDGSGGAGDRSSSATAGERSGGAPAGDDGGRTTAWGSDGSDGATGGDGRRRSTAEAYVALLDERPARFASAVAAIAEAPPGAVVVQCAAGKDRTGIVVALALALAGVEPEWIAWDYELTDERLRRHYDAMLAGVVSEEERARWRSMRHARAETMHRMLHHLDDSYGGAAGYLTVGGLTDDQATALIARLVE